MFKEYDKLIADTLSEYTDPNWREVLEKHKEMISIIQHERLIHLLVMIFVGIVMSLSFLLTIISEKAYLLFLDLPLLFLFIGYLFHYRFLENTTQKWYSITDTINKKLTEKK